MSKTKIAITLDEDFVAEIDHLIKDHKFMNRSQAIQEAVKDKLQKIKKSRLAEECSKLVPSFEQAMAEALAKSLPIIILNPLPGQENLNAHMLVENGLAIKASDESHAAKQVDGLLDDPKTVKKMRTALSSQHHTSVILIWLC